MTASIQAIEIFVAISSVVVGLSHLLQPAAWVAFFHWLRDRGLAGVVANGLLSLSFGSLVVAFHPVWRGLPAVVTMFGGLQVAKALFCMVTPNVALRSLERVQQERAHEFRLGGVVLLVLGGVAACCAATSPP